MSETNEIYELVKATLRVTTDDKNIQNEIQACIDGAIDDLKTAGVPIKIAEDTDNPLVKQAVIFYAKSVFGYDNPDAARFNGLYEMKKNVLAEMGDINADK